MSTLKYWKGVNLALLEEMDRDPLVCLLGEDVGLAGGPFGSTQGLFSRFGEKRVRDTPISELAMMGVGTGAAMTGIRPVVEIMYMDFLLLALDQLVNQAAKMRFMSGGRYAVPLTVMTMVAARTQSGPQHSQSFETWTGQVPGLRVVWPSNAADAKGLLKSAIRSDDPVVFIESLSAWRSISDVPDGEHLVPLGRAAIVRAGSDITLVAVGGAVATAVTAAERLSELGIQAEIVDLRSISPLDEACVIESVAKTRALIAVQEGPEVFGVGRQVVSAVALTDPALFRYKPRILAPPFAPIPFAPKLEAAYYPDVKSVVSAATQMLEGKA
jgi:pyruvate dehydrogenase E1 component beta subunit